MKNNNSIKIEFLKLAVAMVLSLATAACSPLQPKNNVRDFDADYLVKPLPGRAGTPPDSAWLAGHLNGFNPLLEPFKMLFSKRLWESSTIAPAPDGTGAVYTMQNDDYRIDATVRLKPVEKDVYRLSIHAHVDDNIGSDAYLNGLTVTPKYRVNRGLEHLLTSLAEDYEVYEGDLNGYRINPGDTWFDRNPLAWGMISKLALR